MPLVLFALFVLLIFLVYLGTKKPEKFPPGPRWLPILGCAVEMNGLRKKFGSMSMASYQLSSKYGPLVGLRLGCHNIVLINGFKEMQELLSREELNGRPNEVSATCRTWGKRMGIIFNDSISFKEQKAFALQQFRKFGFRKQDLEEIFDREMRAMVANVKKMIAEDRVIRADNLCNASIAKSVWSLLSEGQCDLSETEVEEFDGAMGDFSKNVYLVGDVFTYLPFLIRICPNLCGYSSYVSIHNRITNFIREQIRKVKGSYDRAGFIGEYLKLVSDSENDASEFSEDHLVVVCLDMIIGSFETLTSMANSALMHLLLHPDIQKRAQEELDRVVGRDRFPNLEDRYQLPYVDCVVLEIFRVTMGRALTVPRRATADTVFKGYFIPKNCILLGNFRSVSLNEDDAMWKNANAFHPERFLKDGKVAVPEHFMPFGFGKRRCPGEIFGRSCLFLIVASLLQAFQFKALPDAPPASQFLEDFLPGVKPFRAIVTLR